MYVEYMKNVMKDRVLQAYLHWCTDDITPPNRQGSILVRSTHQTIFWRVVRVQFVQCYRLEYYPFDTLFFVLLTLVCTSSSRPVHSRRPGYERQRKG